MSVTKGLEGVVATSSSISSIIDDTLTYVGFDIDDLADNASFEEVIYLLWHRRLPNKLELEDLKNQLAANAGLPDEIIQHFKMYPINKVHPMGALRTAVSLLGLYDEEADIMDEEANYRKAVRLQAKIPSIVTAFSRIRKGEEPIAPRKDFGYAQNFLYMLTGNEPEQIEIEAFNKALVLHADHELNASTFTARVCVATLSDIYSGVTAAIGALKGPLHGGANEAVMKMLTEIETVDNVEPYITNKLANKEKIMGFGHRVYRKGPLPPNVDFYSASVYHSLGIDHDLFTPIFAMSRMSGWIAHILEQYENNRLIRPRAEYVGPDMQKYVPINER